MPDSPTLEEKEGTEDTTTMTTYCVPVDEVDPTITDTLNLEIPLNGQYSPNKAVNNLIQMVIYFSSFLILILVSVVTIPFFYNIFILEVIKDFINEKEKPHITNPEANANIAQMKLNSLFGTDVLSFISIVIIIILCILDGITNNNIASTIISIFLFIFGVISYGRIQLMKMDENKFIKEFTGEPAGTIVNDEMTAPSFSKNNIKCITDTLMNTLKYIFWEDNFVYAVIYIILYSLSVTFVTLFTKWSESTIGIFSIIMFIVDVYVVSYIKYMAHKYFKTNTHDNPTV